MSAPPLVRRANARELAAAARVLADAFANEAGLNWWLRQGQAKDRVRRRFFGACVRGLISPKREIWTAHGEAGPAGVAIWLPPGAAAFESGPLDVWLGPAFFWSIAGFDGMRRAQKLGALLGERHPPAPHAHLVFLGVAPAAQGAGFGSALLKHTLARVDAQRTPAFLETTTARNVALYRRHGFEVTGEFEAPGGGPRFWCMARPAAP